VTSSTLTNAVVVNSHRVVVVVGIGVVVATVVVVVGVVVVVVTVDSGFVPHDTLIRV